MLARHYGFTDEQLDFIINYDIKYRMGKEAEGDSEQWTVNSGESAASCVVLTCVGKSPSNEDPCLH